MSFRRCLAPQRPALLAPRAEHDQEPPAPKWKVASEDTLRTPTLVCTPVTNSGRVRVWVTAIRADYHLE